MNKNIFLLLMISCFLFFSCNKYVSCVSNNSTNCPCTSILSPVCGCNNVTYGNACAAECAGITIYTSGACK
jgi:hypothetical protein